MCSTHAALAVPIILAVLALPAGARGQTPPQADNPYPYAADEPRAKAASLAKSADYLDGVARFWMRQDSCGACHANFAYLMARPVLSGGPTPLAAETRQFLERRRPNPKGFSFEAEAVAIAFGLAWDDAHTGGRLRPATRQALGRMWALQRPDGWWEPMGCGRLVPAENDLHYTTALAALAAGVAPEGYARSAEAQDGLTRLRRAFVKYPARNLHDEALRLWASLHLDGLMTAAERKETVRRLLARQRGDGGWSLAALGSSGPGRPVAPDPVVSDGYATALVIYVLQQAGVPATRPEIVHGAAWLRSNQRASGRWFTPSRAAGHATEGGVGARDLYVQNLGTAFAVLALQACEGAEGRLAPIDPPLRAPGLALRGRLIPD